MNRLKTFGNWNRSLWRRPTEKKEANEELGLGGTNVEISPRATIGKTAKKGSDLVIIYNPFSLRPTCLASPFSWTSRRAICLKTLETSG